MTEAFSFVYDSAHPTYLETICVLSDVALIVPEDTLVGAGGRGAVQGGPVLVVPLPNVGAALEQRLHGVGHLVGGGQVQRSVVILVTVVLGVLVIVEDVLHHLDMPPLRRHVKGGLLVLILVVALCTCLDQ